jgi:DNA-binding CsgD family transcriptional regulator/PAS domain-containing protein
MGDDEKLTRLIAAIYDAALDCAMWPAVLAGIADFVDGRVGGLLTKDSNKKQIDVNWHAGVDTHYMRLYATTYSRLGPLATSPSAEVGQIVGIPELVPYDEFLDSRFYREWAGPQRWVDVAVAVLEKSVDGGTYLVMSRDETSGMVDRTMRRRMALLVPHVRRAARIGKAIEIKHAQAATFADILDGLSAALFLVDAGGRIVYANSAADDMLGRGDLLRSVGGRLVASEADIDQALRETAAAAATGDATIGAGGVAIPLRACDGVRFVAHALPLSAGARNRVGAAYGAAAAFFVRKAELEYPSAAGAVGKSYELTPTELRVLRAIVEVGGVPEAAASLGVAESTVKTHLSRLFAKTGVGRQADLVKLVAGFSMPLASPHGPTSAIEIAGT